MSMRLSKELTWSKEDMAQLLLRNVSKVYDEHVKAVDALDLEVADGEFMVIVGPSGCGKTTILRMIAGLEEVTQGTISIDGTIVNDISPKDRDVAMVFQTHALYPHMNVFQNIAFGLKLRKVSKCEIMSRVNNVAQMLGIKELLKRKPVTLSGGQRQRVALGRAIVGNPKVFLFDEPLSNLDAKFRTRTRIQLKQLHLGLNTTSVYVTHDQIEAMTLGDRICVLKAGVVQQIGTPRELYDKPRNSFVGGFFGIPPMNFFKGEIKILQGKALFVFGQDSISLSSGIRECIADRNVGDIVMGIRPEHLKLNPGNDPHQDSIIAKVTAIEEIGSVKSIYLESRSGENIVVALSCDNVIDSGSTTRIYFDTTKMHFFESNEDGRNIGL
jgi:multiple sugar transport system ATP-binding protein